MAITFHVGTRGLESDLDYSLIYSDEEFYNEDLPPNVSWEHVTVADVEAKEKWLNAKEIWLSAAWTPNQSPDERKENSLIMKQMMDVMSYLEVREE